MMVCLYALTGVRLEIGFCPFTFQSQNHNLISTILLFLILVVPFTESGMRMVVDGQLCQADAHLLVSGLYGQPLPLPTPNNCRVRQKFCVNL